MIKGFVEKAEKGKQLLSVSHMHNAVNLSLKKFSESSNTQRLPRQVGGWGSWIVKF